MKKNLLFSFFAIVMIAFVGCNRPEDEGNGTQSGQLNGHAYVDLGLPSGTLWATCNVGANTATDYGNQYAWGETSPKEFYSMTNYRYYHLNNNENPNYSSSWCWITKYCDNEEIGYNGFTDNLYTLEASDDAATVNWGSGWRMPTRYELVELYNTCNFSWQLQNNGVVGYSVTGPNGNSIFFPYIIDVDGGINEYWTSSLYYNCEFAYICGFNDNEYGDSYYIDNLLRDEGCLIRPVCSSSQE